MRMFILRSLIIIAVAVVVGDMASHAETLYGPAGPIPQAPIGHLQPRAPHFSPRSGAEQVEQDRMSAFDVEQKKFDQELDRKLNICRC